MKRRLSGRADAGYCTSRSCGRIHSVPLVLHDRLSNNNPEIALATLRSTEAGRKLPASVRGVLNESGVRKDARKAPAVHCSTRFRCDLAHSRDQQ